MSSDPLDSSPAETQDLVRELVAKCLDRFESEGGKAVDSICREHPEHEALIRRRLETLRNMGLLLHEPSKDEAIPERLGEFRLLRRLGGGGMGVVYLATQESLGREVALKLVRPEFLYFPGARERFRREVESIAKLHHPGIVPIYSVGEAADIPFFAMEYLEGASLGDVLEVLRGRKPESLTGADLDLALRALTRGDSSDASSSASPAKKGSWVEICFRIVLQVAEALHHSHQRGILHRDLKPSNVMLTLDGRAMLVDFGIASSHASQALTKTGSQIGSVPYMSPEQLRGQIQAISARSDVYSLGVTLYEMLTLQSAFLDSESEITRRRVLEGRFTPIRTWNTSVPWDAESVCLKAMDPDPARRYAKADDFARDLQNVLELRPIEARRPTASLRARRFVQRNPTLSVGLTLGALLLLVAPGIWGLQEHRRNVALNAANAQVLANLKIANDERAKAERNARRARSAVTTFVAMVGDELLLNVPHAEEKRKKLLEQAVRVYDEFLEENSGDVDVRLETSQNYRRLGNSLRDMENFEPAENCYRRALDVLEPSREAHGKEPNWRQTEAMSLSDLGRLMISTKRFDPANEVLEQSVTILKELTLERPNHVDTLQSLAITENVFGNLLLNGLKHYEPAAEVLQSSADHWDELVRLTGDEKYAVRAVMELNNIANVFHSQGKDEEAESYYRECMDRVSGLWQENSAVVELRLTYYGSRRNLCGILVDGERFEECEPLLNEAIEEVQKLAADFPQQPEYSRELACCWEMLGSLHLELDERESARGCLETAIRLTTGQVKAGSQSSLVLGVHAESSYKLAALSEEGDEIARSRENLQWILEPLELFVAANPDEEDLRSILCICRLARAAIEGQDIELSQRMVDIDRALQEVTGVAAFLRGEDPRRRDLLSHCAACWRLLSREQEEEEAQRLEQRVLELFPGDRTTWNRMLNE